MKFQMTMAAGVVGGMLLGTISASAAITGVAGATTWLGAPPVSCMPGALVGPTAYTWNEKQNVLVVGALCDMVNNPGNSASPVIGTVSGRVDSHFIHFEPNTATQVVNGQVTFAGKIRGVMFRQNTLDVTDVSLGSLGTTYPTGNIFRGLNLSSIFQINNNVLTFHFASPLPTSDLIELRVLTEHVVPAPGAMAVVGLGGLVAARRRRV